MERDAGYLKAVREQYENYPYPPRDPNVDSKYLISTTTEYLARINHYCFEGRLDLKMPFRVLVAGGGTGDATIFLAEQLRHTDAEIVHLDISQASMDVAKKRADVCKLKNIQWMHASILDIPTLNLGRFNYINCSGVLHHLADPEAGFDALMSVLDEKGGMGIMLYGKYGRTAVYQLQELLRLVNQGESNMQQKVDNAKSILAALPKSNWYQHSKDWMIDVVKYGDSGVYDLLLHSQDRAYSVPELYEWFVDRKGMHMFLDTDFGGHLPYEPDNYLQDRTMKDKIGALSQRDKETVAELLAGNFMKHTMYITHSESSCAKIDDIDNVPFLAFGLANLDSRELGAYIEKNLGKQVHLDVDNGKSRPSMKLTFKPGRYSQHVFRYLDGENSLREIFEIVKNRKHLRKQGITTEALLEDFRETYSSFHAVGGMLLRHKHTDKFDYIS